MAILTVEGVEFTGIQQYEVILQDLDSENTTRNEDGDLTRDRVAVKYTVKTTLRRIKTDLESFADALSGESLSVTFFNPYDAENTTTTMYAGNRSARAVSPIVTGDEDNSWFDMAFDLIEF